jgi:hypothetical protein
LCFALSGYFSSADQNPAAFARDSARTTNLCESSRPRRSLRERRLPASCVPHGAPSGFATFTSAWSYRLSVPSPLISLLSSTERGMLRVRRSRRSGLPPGARAGQGSHQRPPRRHTGFSALLRRFAAAASRRALRAIRVPADIRVVFACASPSPCFRFCSLFFSALPACQTDLARPSRC